MVKVYISAFLILLSFSFVSAQKPQDIDNANDTAEAMLNQNPNQSLESAAKTRSAADGIKSAKKGVAKAVSIMGVANFKIDDYVKAKTLMTEAAKLSDEIKDTFDLAYCKYWLGEIELNQGRYSNALDLYETANRLAEKSGDKKNLARSIDGKASIYEALGDDVKALQLYQQGMAIAKEANFKTWYPTVLLSLGNLAYKKGKSDEAMGDFFEAIKISDEVGNLNNKADCYQQLASIYVDKKDSKEAMNYIQQAMALFQKTGSQSSFSRGRLLMSTIALNDKDYKQAIEWAGLSLDEGKQSNDAHLQQDAADILYYSFLKEGDKAKALNYLILFLKLSDANHNEELTRKAAQIELIDNLEKEREIGKIEEAKHSAELNAQIERQKLIKKVSFIGIFLLAIIAGLAVFAFTQNRKDSSLIATEKKKTDALLLNILPEETVAELKKVEYKANSMASVLFADIKGFSGSAGQKPKEDEPGLDFYFKAFDQISANHKIEKIRTIDDAYLSVGCLEVPDKENAVNVIYAALEMRQFVERSKKERLEKGAKVLEISIGIHTGPLVAGIVGIRKFSHDIWGDTVAIAARMEQHGEGGRINISGSTYNLVKDQFICVPRLAAETKKGDKKEKIDMYFVEGKSSNS